MAQAIAPSSPPFSDHPLMSIHGNHTDMVKFATVEDNGFRRLAGELVRGESELSAPAHTPASPEPAIQSLSPRLSTDREKLYHLFLTSLPTDPVPRDTSQGTRGRLFSELLPWNHWLQGYLANGLPVNIRDFDGKTPLHHALTTRYDREAKVRALLEAGADVAMRDFDEETPLELAKALDEALFVSLLRAWQRSLTTK